MYSLSREEGIELLTGDCEKWAEVIFTMLRDPRHLNNSSREYREALEQFNIRCDAVFRWKNAWDGIDFARKRKD